MNKNDIATGDVHILWNPNKNYIGHWDIPGSDDLILTIEKIVWEDVENPTTGSKEGKRVVHFIEDVKPMICNEENANAIFKSCGVEKVKDYNGQGFKVALFKLPGKWFGEEREAVRVRDTKPEPKKKEVLTEGHEKWEKASEKVKSGETTIEDIRKHYVISDEDFNTMLK